MFNNAAIDTIPRIDLLQPAALADDHTPSMTQREWLSLGVLCVAAAENSHNAGNHNKSRYYAALAVKCDELAAELPRAARGSIPIPVEK